MSRFDRFVGQIIMQKIKFLRETSNHWSGYPYLLGLDGVQLILDVRAKFDSINDLPFHKQLYLEFEFKRQFLDVEISSVERQNYCVRNSTAKNRK